MFEGKRIVRLSFRPSAPWHLYSRGDAETVSTVCGILELWRNTPFHSFEGDATVYVAGPDTPICKHCAAREANRK
jgi:hypothetical protein